ncbi:uncharacterized protein EDB91DRAFT_889924 [Suillus paluster]|uniref:uncharacterized protein n=1 Tax=Suillus paluster TaxID=48578 RepID=UPI001B873FCB|nr:uncharacterized protein EDB91DRAFT_889924 [Suillus paluster]KAG1727555.1 hypothetical protein EDB91DRAFT_889924 [Suillus paluster]
MSTIFNGDSQMEVITVLANCGTDIARARQALTRYIARKQEKGRSTEHILTKLRQLESKFINDTTLHAAFRDARANTCLPRSPDLPLPDFVLRKIRRDSRQSLPALRDITTTATASPGPSTPRSWIQSPSSPVEPEDSYIVEEHRTQPEQASLTRHSQPPTNYPGKSPVLSPYAYQTTSGRSRSSTLPSSIPSSFTHPRSPKKLRTSFNSPPPTIPLPDLPTDLIDNHDSRISQLYLPPPVNSRHLSFSSQSSSSTHSSFPSPRTPEIIPTPCPGFSSQSTAIVRGDETYPSQKPEKSPQRPLVVMEHYPSEMDIPSMFSRSRQSSFNASESPGGDFPVAYRDSPILRERSASRDISFPLDNALRLCAASLVVRQEVTKCLQQDRGYEQYNWPSVLQQCDMAEEDIPFLLNEMAREVEFISRS